VTAVTVVAVSVVAVNRSVVNIFNIDENGVELQVFKSVGCSNVETYLRTELSGITKYRLGQGHNEETWLAAMLSRSLSRTSQFFRHLMLLIYTADNVMR
jgi:hypothetical protein